MGLVVPSRAYSPSAKNNGKTTGITKPLLQAHWAPGWAAPTPKKILKALRDKDPDKAYEFMLLDVMQVQGGFKEVGTKSRETNPVSEMR